MRASAVALVPFLVASALAQTLAFFESDDCTLDQDSDHTYEFKCGYDCTNVDPSKDKSARSALLEPNQQIVLFTEKDCKGDAYAAIGMAYGATVATDECAVACDGFASFKTNIFNDTGGGDACPPGSLTAAPSRYPKPTDTSC